MKLFGYSARHNSWVDESDMNCNDPIAEFEETMQIIYVKKSSKSTHDEFLVRFKGDDLRNLTVFSRDDLMKNHATKLQQFLKDGCNGYSWKLTRGFCHRYDIFIDSTNFGCRQKIRNRRKTYPAQLTQSHAENIMEPVEILDVSTTPTMPMMPIIPTEANSSNEGNSSSSVMNRLQINNAFDPFKPVSKVPFFLRRKRLKSMF